MIDIEFSVEGLTQYELRIRKFREDLTPHLAKALEQVAESIVATAKAIVPVRTGRLRDSIRWQRGTETSILVQAGGPAAPYAGYVENGTSTMAARPFLYPAIAFRQGEMVAIIERELGT